MGLRIFMVISLAAAAAACSPAKFSSKQDVLSKTSVFGLSNEDATGRLRQPGSTRNDDDGTGSIPQPSTDQVPFVLTCSDSDSGQQANFKRAMAQNLPVQLTVNGTSCSTDINVIKNLVQKGLLTRADIKSLCPSAEPAAGTVLKGVLYIDGKPYDEGGSQNIRVLWALNRQTTPANEAADQYCDRRSSPLVVHVSSNPEYPLPVQLSSQADGVLFDLLGARNDYRPVQISWFTNREYRFLALPNEYGEVLGIEDLFGDNTLGPDGEYAENGYAALAKYDGTTADGMFQLVNPDGIIDRRDPIYYKLRLWLDADFDGRGQAHEMTSLARAGIAYIDLGFSTDYSERDQYGNETKMKSVVGYDNGSLNLIFDLWFAYRLGGD